MSEDKKDNVIQFPGPKDKETEIVFEPDPGLDYNSTEKNLVDTMEFVESCVDDLSITLIKNFVDIGVKIEKPQFLIRITKYTTCQMFMLLMVQR